MKKTQGLSYVEVIIAMALFAIALLAIMPTLSQAGHNMAFAQRAYTGHLQAQRMMLVVRDALMDGANPEAEATRYAAGDFEFSVWIFGQNAREFHSTQTADVSAAIAGKNTTMAGQASTIVAVIWCEDGHMTGRAIGMLYP